MIENKVNFKGTDNQSLRYKNRLEKYERLGVYGKCDCILICPEEYRKSNLMAQDYPHYITYQKLQEHFKGKDKYAPWKWKRIDDAIKKCNPPVTDEEFVKVWRVLFDYIYDQYYDVLPIDYKEKNSKTGAGAAFHLANTNYKRPVRLEFSPTTGRIQFAFRKYSSYELEALAEKTFNKYLEKLTVFDYSLYESKNYYGVNIYTDTINLKLIHDEGLTLASMNNINSAWDVIKEIYNLSDLINKDLNEIYLINKSK